jgi:hypothetical protein
VLPGVTWRQVNLRRIGGVEGKLDLPGAERPQREAKHLLLTSEPVRILLWKGSAGRSRLGIEPRSAAAAWPQNPVLSQLHPSQRLQEL